LSLPPSCLGCIPAPHRLQVRPRLAPRRRAAAFELTAKEAGSVSSHPPSRPQARCGCGTTTRANACARTAATRTQSTHPRPLTLPHVVPLCPVATLPRPFRDLSETFPRDPSETLPQVLLRRRLRHVLRPAPDRVGVRGADTPPLRTRHTPARTRASLAPGGGPARSPRGVPPHLGPPPLPLLPSPAGRPHPPLGPADQGGGAGAHRPLRRRPRRLGEPTAAAQQRPSTAPLPPLPAHQPTHTHTHTH